MEASTFNVYGSLVTQVARYSAQEQACVSVAVPTADSYIAFGLSVLSVPFCRRRALHAHNKDTVIRRIVGDEFSNQPDVLNLSKRQALWRRILPDQHGVIVECIAAIQKG